MCLFDCIRRIYARRRIATYSNSAPFVAKTENCEYESLLPRHQTVQIEHLSPHSPAIDCQQSTTLKRTANDINYTVTRAPSYASQAKSKPNEKPQTVFKPNLVSDFKRNEKANTYDNDNGRASRTIVDRKEQRRRAAEFEYSQNNTCYTVLPRKIVTYHLKTFSLRLTNPPKDRHFRAEDNILYHNQRTECHVVVHDQYKAEINIKKAQVRSDSRQVYFGSVKALKHLYFNMKCDVTGKISIILNINDSHVLTKDFIVSFNPCSTSLSEMTIHKLDLTSKEFTYRLHLFDVFGVEVPMNSNASFCLHECFSSSNNGKILEVSKVTDDEMYQLCYDIRVTGERSLLSNFQLHINGDYVNVAQKYKFTQEELEEIDKLEDDEHELAEEVFLDDNDQFAIPLTNGKDEGRFVAYDEDDCKLQLHNGKNYKLVCRNITKHDIMTSNGIKDFAYINNIKRVLQINDRLEIEQFSDGVIIHLPNAKKELLISSKKLVGYLLCGLYYRRKASEIAKIRMIWKNRLNTINDIILLTSKSPSHALCMYFKDFFGALMNQYNRAACDKIFTFFNICRLKCEVDLHGLLVADEEALELLRLNLMIAHLNRDVVVAILQRYNIFCRKRGREKMILKQKFNIGSIPNSIIETSYENQMPSGDDRKDVETIIKECRKESDEAIRKLEEYIDKYNVEEAMQSKTPWLEIIVGAGRHGKIPNKQNIRPKVEKFLEERKLNFELVNKGSLVITYKRYEGPQPCFGEYYCANCDRFWSSSKSYVGKYQKCKDCREDCWPVKQREKKIVSDYSREGKRPRKCQNRRHESSLCQQCQDLGRPCNEYDSDESDY